MDKDCGYSQILPTMEKINESMSQNNLKPEMCVGNNSESHMEKKNKLGHKVKLDGFKKKNHNLLASPLQLVECQKAL